MKRLVLTALGTALPLGALGALGGIAHADVSDADQAKAIIGITKTDKVGDVRAEDRNGAHTRVERSIDLSRVDYRLDRTAETLTITYDVRRVLDRDGFRQFVGTTIVDRSEDDSPFGLVMSGVNRSALRVSSYDDNGEFHEGVCKAGTSSTDAAADTITQTVPFSCLGAVERGAMKSWAVVERSRGRDVAWDQARFTRDLPLTAYVPPADPPAAD
jgi:hypothetical protein